MEDCSSEYSKIIMVWHTFIKKKSQDDPQLMEEPVRYSRPWTRRSRVSQPVSAFHSHVIFLFIY